MLTEKLSQQVDQAAAKEFHAASLIKALGNPSEWTYTGIVDEAVDGRCACGHPIRFRYHIQHPTNGRTAVVGSTCIDHLAWISPALGVELTNAREQHEKALREAEAKARKAAADAENAALWTVYCEARDKAFAMHKANRAAGRKSSYELWYFCCGYNEGYRRSAQPQYTRAADLKRWLKKAIERAQSVITLA